MLTFNKGFTKLLDGSPTTFLNGNALTRLQYQFDVFIGFEIKSTLNNQIIIDGENKFKLVNGSNWGEYGFVVGNEISYSMTINPPDGSSPIAISGTSVILSIQGSTLIHSVPLNIDYVGELFPTSFNTQMTVTNNDITAPEVIDVYFNLVPNGQAGGRESLIDESVNQIRFATISGGGQILGNRSGGGITQAFITNLGSGSYRILIGFTNWLFWNGSDLSKPEIFQGTNSIKPWVEINAFGEANNPNSIIKFIDNFQDGNVGWFDENYNQGQNNFTSEIEFRDIEDNPIAELDYTKKTKVKITLNSNAPINGNFDVVTCHLPTDENDWKENGFNFLQNTFRVTDEYESNTISASDSFGKLGGLFSTDNHSVDVNGNTTVIEFEIEPNQDLTDYLEAREGDRGYLIGVELFNTSQNNLVSLLVKSGQMEQAPLIGKEAEEVESFGFLIHPEDATESGVLSLQAYTEDDILVKSLFKLKKSENYDAINVSFRVVRQSDGVFFNLFKKSINAFQFDLNEDTNVRFWDYEENLGFNLPNPMRNVLSLKFNGNEDNDTYEVEFWHTLLLSWRYWVRRADALDSFLNVNLPNNGLNDEWVRYAQNGYDFVFRIDFVKDGVTDFYNAPITIKTYDDSTTTSVIKLENIQGQQIPGFISDENSVIVAEHLGVAPWNQPETWGWIAIRPDENEPRVLISNKWAYQSTNQPLRPLANETEANTTFPSAELAVLKCETIGGQINGEMTVVSRIGSPERPECVSLLTFLFQFLRTINAEQRLKSLQTVLDEGVAYPKPNGFCCPSCTGAPCQGFGNIASTINYPSLISLSSICCIDEYEFGGIESFTCDANFAIKIESFLDELEALGGFDANVYKSNNVGIGQLNADFLCNIDLIISEIKISFTPSQWAAAWNMLTEKSICIFCNEDGIFLGSVNAVIAKVNE